MTLLRIVRSSFINNLFISFVLFAAFAVVNSAAGELVEANWQAADDGKITFDTETGMQWLDLTESTDLTVAEVSAEFGSGGDFEGFRYATSTEVGEFYTNAGLSGFGTTENFVDGDSNAARIAAAEALQAMWGVTEMTDGEGQDLDRSLGFIDEFLGGSDYRLATLEVSTVAPQSWATGTRGSTAGSASDNRGSALVRLSAVSRDSLLGAESETGNLLAVDPMEGTGELIAPTGVTPLTALAKDPTTGILYGGEEGWSSPSSLYIIDEFTGATQVVGSTGGIKAINAADFDATGQLWASVRSRTTPTPTSKPWRKSTRQTEAPPR